MDRQEKQAYQELLSSQGWALFKALVFQDRQEGTQVRKGLRSQVQDKMNAAVRAEENDKASYYLGQLDILQTIVDLPERHYKKGA